MKIRILPEVERDLDIGADFYESEVPGAGSYFIRRLFDNIDGLLNHGGVYAKYRVVHRAMSDRFPFTIFSDLNGDLIDIYAVLDCRQAPATNDDQLAFRKTDRGVPP